MAQREEIRSLEGLLDRISEETGDENRVSIGEAHEAAGQRSFGPLLLIPGLIALSPLSGIPGAPTTVGLMVLLIAGQLLIGRSEFWLPKVVLRRSVSRSRFDKAMKVMRPIARFIDRLIKPRLSILTQGPAVHIIAAVCIGLALLAPLLEVLPFAITGVGAALTAFALALIAEDGLLGLIALTICVGTGVVAGMALLG